MLDKKNSTNLLLTGEE